MHARLFLSSVYHGFFGMTSAYYLTVMNSLEPFVKDFANQSINDRYGINVTESQLSFAWSISAAAFPFGAVFGSILSRIIAERFGRRATVMVFTNVLLITAGLLMWVAEKTGGFELFVFARILTGCSRTAQWFIVTYLTESTPPQSRGFTSLVTVIGSRIWLMGACFLALPEVFGTPEHWQLLLLLPVPFAIVHLCTTPLFPQSPKFLYIVRERREEAIKAIQFYYGDDADYEQVIASYDREKKLTLSQVSYSVAIFGFGVGLYWLGGTLLKNSTFREVMSERHLRIPFLLCMLVAVSPPLMGVDIATFFSTGIMHRLGVENAALFTAVFVHGPSLIVCTISVLLVDRVGRRFCHLFGFAIGIVATFLLFLAGMLHLGGDVSVSSVMSVVALLLSANGNSIGPGFMFAILPAELCPQASRTFTWRTATCFGWGTGCLVILTYPILESLIGPFSILPLTCTGVLVFTILFLYLPETAGKTVDEVHLSASWVASKKLDTELENMVIDENDNRGEDKFDKADVVIGKPGLGLVIASSTLSLNA